MRDRKATHSPKASAFGPMGDRLGVLLTFAGATYLRQYAEILAPLSLSPGRVLALSFISEHPGCDQSRLSRGLAINRSSTMKLVAQLENLGFVERRKIYGRRNNALHLMPHGEESFAAALHLEDALSTRVFAQLQPDDLASLKSSLSLLITKLNFLGG